MLLLLSKLYFLGERMSKSDFKIKNYEFNSYIVYKGSDITIYQDVDWDGNVNAGFLIIETQAEHIERQLKYKQIDSNSLNFIKNISNINVIKENVETKTEDGNSMKYEVIVKLIIDIKSIANSGHISLGKDSLKHAVNYIFKSLVTIHEYRYLREIEVNAVINACSITFEEDISD